MNDARLGGYELHYGLSPGSYNAMIDVGNTTNYIVTGLNAGTTYFFCVRAYSQDKSLVSNFSNEVRITIPQSGQAPTISGTSGTTVSVGTAYSFQPSASDPDGDALSFGITNPPSWASFNAATGALTGTPGSSDVGTTSNIVISVTDGTESASLPPFDLTVTQDNRPPTISGTPGTTVSVGTAYSFQPSASDPDGDALSFGITNPPSWASFNAATGALTGTPGDSDLGTTSNIVISVSDGAKTVSLPFFEISVVDSTVADVRIATSADDAEEPADGSMYLNSSDLELVNDWSEQVVGLRFALDVPPGATITAAHVQFTVDETSTGTSDLIIRAQAADDAAVFASTANNISMRPLTSAIVNWSVPDWPTVGQSGAAQRTPDLSALLQEVINRPGWSRGNHVVLVVTGSGHRTAESYDGSSATAPLLSVSHTGSNPTNQYRLTVGNSGSGSGTVTSNPSGINCGSDCTEDYGYNSQVELTANPSTGSTFAGWSGDADCADGQVTMNAAKACTATFAFEPVDAPVLEMEMEMGEIMVDHEWQWVGFEQPFVDAIVVANALSANGSDPAVVQVDGIDANGFWVRLQEWDYLDGIHYSAEVVSYLVMENGSHQLADGSWVEAGRLQTSTTNAFDHTLFEDSFAETPVVLTAVTSANGDDAVTSRIRRVDLDGFEFGLREQEANVQSHVVETIDYIAWEPSSGVTGGLRYEVDRTADAVTHRVHTIVYESAFEQLPMFLANMQSTDGGDTANLRWRNKTTGAVDMWVDEEQSRDSETNHTKETVGYILLEFVN